MSDDDYSPESGHRAEPDRVLEAIRSRLESAGVNAELQADPHSLSWDDPRDRELVRQEFDGNPERDESILPGFGENGRARNAYDDCGDPHPFVCDSCGHSVEFGRTCARSVCARCAVAYVRDSAISKAAKVRRLNREKNHHSPEGEGQKHHHQIISPSLGWFYDLARAGFTLEEALEETREIVKTILDEQRAQGILIRHSYRGADDQGSIKSESDDRGLWKERQFSQRNWYDDVREELAWKPHFHAIVVADHLKGSGFSDVISEDTGWIVHRIVDDENVSLENDGAMARALTYALSHADVDVRENGNRSAVWQVGAYQGDIFKSSSRFTALDHDLTWADNAVRSCAGTVLGVSASSTECGASLPGVDDPDELARRIWAELYPDDDALARDVPTDAVLEHVDEGNITVSVSSRSGGGGDVTVTSAFGDPVGDEGWGSGRDLPDPPASIDAVGAADEVARTIVDDDQEEHADGCDCSSSDVDDDRPDECDGRLIPLEEARERGLLDDDDWRQDAPHVDEADEADREWADLDRWRARDGPGTAIGAG